MAFMRESERPFVLLRHARGQSTHWDLMLDQGDILATWRLSANPGQFMGSDQSAAISACRIQDHRRAYLDAEGPVSQGRGHIYRVDKGVYACLCERAGGWILHFKGSLLQGTFSLTPQSLATNEWMFQRLDE